MNTDTAEDLCVAIGAICQDPKILDSRGRGVGFIRVQVRLDITQPLCCGRVVTLKNGSRPGFHLNMNDS